jgi:hypothetical protein
MEFGVIALQFKSGIEGMPLGLGALVVPPDGNIDSTPL